MLTLLIFLLLSCIAQSQANAQYSAQTFFPASVPLAVRSAYMNVWINGGTDSQFLPAHVPIVPWTNAHLGWDNMIVIDGQPYATSGDAIHPNNTIPATVNGVQITPTRSIYSMQAGPMDINLTFLSPIEPDDWVKQSLPFVYVFFEASSRDGAAHSVSVSSGITAEWATGDRSNTIRWTVNTTGASTFWEFGRRQPEPFKEINHQAEDGTVYYAVSKNLSVSWEEGAATNVNDDFGTKAVLTNNIADPPANASAPGHTPLLSLAVNLGTIKSTAEPVAWALGYIRDPVVQVNYPTGRSQMRRPYYATQYSDISSAIDFVIIDFQNALQRAIDLDTKLVKEASQISSQYSDIVSLAARQTMASLDITVGEDDQGALNASDVQIFMKDISTSETNSGPVEKIYAAFPAFLCMNASLGAVMLSTLLGIQQSGTAQSFASPDLGGQYPQTQNRADSGQGVEQTGNMLIMLLAQAQVTGDASLIAQYYAKEKQWADYLVANSLLSENQITAEKEPGVNNSNLAIKGIIGVRAMAEISLAIGEHDDAEQYNTSATNLYNQWLSLAVSSDKPHLLGTYNDESSSSLMYNLFADRWLGTGLISQNVLTNQTEFYKTLLTGSTAFGPPIDSTKTNTSSIMSQLFVAATATDVAVRNQFIDAVWARANLSTTAGPLPEDYDNTNGNSTPDGIAGPAVGSIFSLLALK
ncbi:uncharacterized protein BXZ73DRAFT_41258 [Epithele typhae]|uniref:uncharacterized protein n=1 Tax=Epithele typhae TaxID=378194 RepID=UPI002007D0C0|nr:uncharacterized protein BXZ73DRAFT_41258 [Epithele typhae]KAH9942417.1 hypothetical protein BXZ73DRAFT_41258 [Epithele typhae]